MTHPHPEELFHSPDSATNSALVAFSTSVSHCEIMKSNDAEDFNSHVKQLVGAFQVLTEEIEALRRRYPSVNLIESDCFTKGKTSVYHICQCMGWDLRTEIVNRRGNMRNSSPVEAKQPEMVFATDGEESDPMCPFALPAGLPKKTPAIPQQPQTQPPPSPEMNSRHSRRASDPITAGLHCTSLASPPPSISALASKCPIRYLDQHSPEEVAQYFENHKHELPRSHETCVKRYQSNKESIRQLDAKYGDLVSMIQGLGITHKPLLPATNNDEDDGVWAHQIEGCGRLEEWAEGVNGTCGEVDDRPAVERGNEEEDSERGRGLGRDAKSDRRLMEVRVGESPSRPWGIPVPPLEGPKLASDLEHTEASVTATTNIPGQEANTKRKACPLRSQQYQQPQQNQQPQRQTSIGNPDPTTPSPTVQFKHNAAFISHQPASMTTAATATGGKATAQQQMQMVFTGPVFVGYPIEQAMALLGGTSGSGAGTQG